MPAKKRNYAVMQSGQTQQGFRRNLPKSYGKRRKAYKPRLTYNRLNDMDKKYFVLKDIIPLNLTPDQLYHLTLTISDLRYVPGFTRMTNLYDRFRIMKFGCKFYQTRGLHAVSMCSQDDQDVVTSRDFILRQPSARHHDMNQDNHPAGRTLELRNISNWTDYIGSDDTSVAAALGTITRGATGAISSKTDGTKKAKISFAIMPAAYALNGGSTANGINVEVQVFYHCMALGLSDTTAID